MCGIAGIVSNTPIDLRVIQPMTEMQTHRGPDSGALFFLTNAKASRMESNTALNEPISGTLALGHRRLSIIDTSSDGIQPMHSTKSDCWISYNGEIYNYKELRTELTQQGCRFETETDTEVILRAYEQWGTQCFSRFNGMWALAIFDREENILILSRDRFGIKPLHYTYLNNKIAFASEIKALLTLEGAVKKANIQAIKSYLTEQLVNQTNGTFFTGINAFPPAHYARISLSDTNLNINPTRYWDYPTERSILDYTNACIKLEELFHSSMTQHMRSDVPVGSCLSGGLDSSAIVCSAAHISKNQTSPFYTFTAIFKDRDIDESPWVNEVNTKVSAKAHWVTPKAQNFLDDLDALIWHQEEPFTSASMYAQWCVMREARKANIPVLLDGQGADEILCGYKKFYIQLIKRLITSRHYINAMKEMYYLLIFGDRTLFKWPLALRYLPRFMRSDITLLNKLSTDTLQNSLPLKSPGFSSAESITERQIQDMTRFSVPALLRFEDRNSMAFSIESRVPFLDHRLVEFCISLPDKMKLYKGKTKRIMRDALKKTIPQMILNRRDKMGFGAPEQRWLHEKILTQFITEIESNDYYLGTIIKKDILLATLKHAAKTQKIKNGRMLFQIFILNRWAKRFEVDFTA